MSRSDPELEVERALLNLIGWPAGDAGGAAERYRHVLREFLHSRFDNKFPRRAYDRDEFLLECLRRMSAESRIRPRTRDLVGRFFAIADSILRRRLSETSLSLCRDYGRAEPRRACDGEATSDSEGAPNQCCLDLLRDHLQARGDAALIELLDVLTDRAKGRVH
jgi:hypothetical protein